MRNPITVGEAVALLNRTSLPSVVTEGSDDYRVMRRIEVQLSDLGVDFIPVGGKNSVLQVLQGIGPHARSKCLGIVDLDLWLFSAIPLECQCNNLIFTMGYSIENDLYIDSKIEKFLDDQERKEFFKEIEILAAKHAREISNALSGMPFVLADHASKVLMQSDLTPSLNSDELKLKNLICCRFGQFLRGKTLFELLVRQLNRKGRYTRFSYKQIYEIASAGMAGIFSEMEGRIRTYFS